MKLLRVEKFEVLDKTFHDIEIGPFRWSTMDWSLCKRSKEYNNVWNGIFNLKCLVCLKFTFGCKEHKFCGLCEPCRLEVESVIDTECED